MLSGALRSIDATSRKFLDFLRSTGSYLPIIKKPTRQDINNRDLILVLDYLSTRGRDESSGKYIDQVLALDNLLFPEYPEQSSFDEFLPKCDPVLIKSLRLMLNQIMWDYENSTEEYSDSEGSSDGCTKECTSYLVLEGKEAQECTRQSNDRFQSVDVQEQLFAECKEEESCLNALNSSKILISKGDNVESGGEADDSLTLPSATFLNEYTSLPPMRDGSNEAAATESSSPSPRSISRILQARQKPSLEIDVGYIREAEKEYPALKGIQEPTDEDEPELPDSLYADPLDEDKAHKPIVVSSHTGKTQAFMWARWVPDKRKRIARAPSLNDSAFDIAPSSTLDDSLMQEVTPPPSLVTTFQTSPATSFESQQGDFARRISDQRAEAFRASKRADIDDSNSQVKNKAYAQRPIGHCSPRKKGRFTKRGTKAEEPTKTATVGKPGEKNRRHKREISHGSKLYQANKRRRLSVGSEEYVPFTICLRASVREGGKGKKSRDYEADSDSDEEIRARQHRVFSKKRQKIVADEKRGKKRTRDDDGALFIPEYERKSAKNPSASRIRSMKAVDITKTRSGQEHCLAR